MEEEIKELWDAIAKLRGRSGGANATEVQGRHESAAAPSHGDVRRWNDTTKKWEPRGLVLVTKSADVTITSDSTLSDDADLLFAIGASETWLVEFFIYWQSVTAADIAFSITVPAGASGEWALSKQSGVNSAEPTYRASVAFASGSGIFSDADSKRGAHIFATVENSTTAGNVTLQWAQDTSNGGNTTVKKYSWLRAMQI